MRYRDLCYWLQGFFEISGNKDITSNQLSIIKNHLHLTLKYEKDSRKLHSNQARDFTFWLQGYLEDKSPSQLFTLDATIIMKNLNEVFQHEIDVSMPDEKGELQKIHDNGLHPKDVTYRC